jgi:hypothetical protein
MASKAGSERKRGRRVRQRSAKSDERSVSIERRTGQMSEPPPSPIRDALAKTLTDAQDIGVQLGTAGVTLAKGTVQLARDIAALAGLAGTSVVGSTVAAARDMVERAEGLVLQTPDVSRRARKPLHPAGGRSARRSSATPSAGAAAT